MAHILQFVQDKRKAQKHLRKFLKKISRLTSFDKDGTRWSGENTRSYCHRASGNLHLIDERPGVKEPMERFMPANHHRRPANPAVAFPYPDSETTSEN